MSEETVAHVPVTDATLDAIGAERLFQMYMDRVAECLVDQEQGSRVDGDLVLTLKVSIGRREEGIRYHAVASLKEPGYTGSAVVGHMINRGKGDVRLRIVNPNPQTAFAFPAPATKGEDTGDHPHDTGH